MGPPVPAASSVLQDKAVVRSGLLAIRRRVQGGHAVVQRQGLGNVLNVQRQRADGDMTSDDETNHPTRATPGLCNATQLKYTGVVLFAVCFVFIFIFTQYMRSIYSYRRYKSNKEQNKTTDFDLIHTTRTDRIGKANETSISSETFEPHTEF